MLTTEHLARALIADRERDLRQRHRVLVRMSSGPRHPTRPDPDLEHVPGQPARDTGRPVPATGA